MNRPVYESDGDLANENAVARNLSVLWKAEFKKLPKSYHVDWMACRNNVAAAFAELKCRNNDREKYPTFMLSLAKWMRGKELAAETGVPFFVIVRWNNGIFFHKAGICEVSYGFGGRWDRNDSQDMEPVVFIDINNFKKVKE